MYTRTTTYLRPNTSVDFFVPKPSANIQASNGWISGTRTLSNDELTLVTVANWDNHLNGINYLISANVGLDQLKIYLENNPNCCVLISEQDTM